MEIVSISIIDKRGTHKGRVEQGLLLNHHGLAVPPCRSLASAD